MTKTIEQLQAKVAELTSNVSKWASLAEANQQVAESAQRRADKLAAENARLKAESRDACLGLNDYYGRKLAAAQEECEFQRNAHKQAEELMLEQGNQLTAAQEENGRLRIALDCTKTDLVRMRCPDFFERIKDGYEILFDGHLVNMIGIINDYAKQK